MQDGLLSVHSDNAEDEAAKHRLEGRREGYAVTGEGGTDYVQIGEGRNAHLSYGWWDVESQETGDFI